MKKPVGYLLAFLAVLLIVASSLRIFETQEMNAYDWLMNARPVQPVNPEIVIIEIADDTLKGLGRWPLPRDYHAALIRVLTESGCRLIVFDIMFSEQAKADDAFAEAMRQSGKVLLPVAFRLEEKNNPLDTTPVSSEILGGVAETLAGSAAGMGQINIFIDIDGKVRRLPLVIRHGDTLWPSLGFLAASISRGYSLEKMARRPGEVVLSNNFAVPVDSDCALWVNYPGPWTKSFRHFSYLDVLKAYAARQQGSASWLDLSVFKDKICFVGLTAAGTSDLRANPFDTVYPMIGAQASVCDSILRGAYIRRLPLVTRIVIALVIFLLALGICLKASPVLAFLYCGALAGVYTASVWFLFAFRGIFTDFFLPLASIALAYSAILLHKFFEEAQKRRLLEKELEIAASIQRSFLPPDVRQLGTVQIRSYLKPAKFVGGDFYDIISLDESTFGFFIGDVSGKGVSAALIMAQSISLLRVLARNSRDPAQVLFLLNNQLKPMLQGRFVTGQYLVVHTKECVWEGASAGHMPFIVFNNAHEKLAELVAASGPPLGLVENVPYTALKGGLAAGDKIFMYTDGWTEARDHRGREFGILRLKEALLRGRSEHIDSLLSKLQSQNEKFEGSGRQHDDVTAVLIEFTGVLNS